jgi:hypothetical protein
VDLLGTKSYSRSWVPARGCARTIGLFFGVMAAPRDPSTHVLLTFFNAGRLTALPSRSGYRMAALAILTDRFERDRLYDEREVNAILADDAPDPATLRRLLVDHGYLGRRSGTYWRERPSPPAGA